MLRNQTMASWMEEAKAKGGLAATEELLELEVDVTRPVEVFDIIERGGIWLFFGELEAALGTFVRQGDAAGIFINNRRPRSVQRLTAAHEYGHFKLGHMASLDGSREIDGFSKVRQEVEAQAFALDFLMPLQLVDATWDLLDLPRDANRVHPHQVYQLATTMGVSYIACVVQLRAMEHISYTKSRELLDYKPKEIKRLLTGGLGPADPWADIWPVEEEDAGREIIVRQRDEIRLKLSENPTTGYQWQLDDTEESPFAVIGDDFELIDPLAIGGPGHRFLSLRADLAGTWTLALTLHREWQPNSAVSNFALRVHVEDNEFGGERSGLREGVKRELLARA